MVDKYQPVMKIDSDRNLVFGWAYVTHSADGQQIIDNSGDIVAMQELEEAAYAFTLKFREAGVLHEGEAIGRLVESMVFTKEKIEALGIQPGTMCLGWWVGFYIEDDGVFAKVKQGKFRMFSIQGKGVREEIE